MRIIQKIGIISFLSLFLFAFAEYARPGFVSDYFYIPLLLFIAVGISFLFSPLKVRSSLKWFIGSGYVGLILAYIVFQEGEVLGYGKWFIVLGILFVTLLAPVYLQQGDE